MGDREWLKDNLAVEPIEEVSGLMRWIFIFILMGLLMNATMLVFTISTFAALQQNNDLLKHQFLLTASDKRVESATNDAAVEAKHAELLQMDGGSSSHRIAEVTWKTTKPVHLTDDESHPLRTSAVHGERLLGVIQPFDAG